MKVLTILMAAALAAQAENVKVFPNIDEEIMRIYGGESLREGLIKAGVPLDDSDKIVYRPGMGALECEAGDEATEFVEVLVSEMYGLRPGVSDAEAVRTSLTGTCYHFEGVVIGGSGLRADLKFEPDFTATEVDSPSWREPRTFRWAVTQKGQVQVREPDGRMLFVGRLDPVGHLLVSSPGNKTELRVTPFDRTVAAEHPEDPGGSSR